MNWSIYFVAIATLGALPGIAASAEKRPDTASHGAPVLNDVAALDKLVTYTETKIPLGELLRLGIASEVLPQGDFPW